MIVGSQYTHDVLYYVFILSVVSYFLDLSFSAPFHLVSIPLYNYIPEIKLCL
jgi:hypothetical protein